ncbi:MAG TPA: CPBP family glutamic-type intramembrane protease [Methylomirabilota bacterium]|nr:CPBP family glutamic-type intramembrane protease [Methylomirabilota bacterium]
MLAVLATVFIVAAASSALGWLPDSGVRAVGLAAGHGALLATAIAWAGGRAPRSAGVVLAPLLIFTAAAASALSPLGAAAYLAPPALVWCLTAKGGLAALGLAAPVPWPAVLAGAGFGALLGGHLLLTASLTLGYHLSVGAPGMLLGWLAYDVGANVLSSECFFRGALFGRAERRWPFAVAVTVSTGACLVRYLVDPLLPRSAAVAAGAVFYLAVLGVAACWLRSRTGSLLPGAAAALLFFAAYRLLAADEG